MSSLLKPSTFIGALLGALCLSPLAHAQSGDEVASLCRNGVCQPVISQTTYRGRAAYRLTDGQSEAVVVPAIGRVMRYGRVGGPNLMWNADSVSKNPGDWKNFGGDKTWLSQQSYWKVMHNAKYGAWPPDPAFDGTPQRAQVLSGGKLKLVSNTSPRIGIRLERVMYFNTRGEFVIEQTMVKTAGAPVRVGLWSISQSLAPDAVFVPTSPSSPYKNDFYSFAGNPKNQQVVSVQNGVFVLRPVSTGGGQKYGVDAPRVALVATKSQTAWLQRASKPAGSYPDGADVAGFPVEVYVNGDKGSPYVELELCGPLTDMFKGMSSTYTVRWSLHDLPSRDVNDAATRAAITGLLK